MQGVVSRLLNRWRGRGSLCPPESCFLRFPSVDLFHRRKDAHTHLKVDNNYRVKQERYFIVLLKLIMITVVINDVVVNYDTRVQPVCVFFPFLFITLRV